MENVRKKYKIIYADPPWDYRVWKKTGGKRTAKSHYQTLTLDELKRIPVQTISDKDAVLLMWVTFPLLHDALLLGAAWGFTYKTVAFTWVKLNKKNDKYFIGMGHYTRANAELVLLFTRGQPLPRLTKNIEQLVISRRSAHSQKPHEVRKRIVQLFGDLRRIELFARSREGMYPDIEYEGWDVFGDEANGSVSLLDSR